jgi:dTDP-4-amino-4,6-dideoxygalactose transaminase
VTAPPPIPFLDLSRAAGAEAGEMEDVFRKVLRKGRFILGKEVESFEREFAAFAGASFGVGCANGTDAITLALRALGVGPGDDVLTVSMTCAPTAVGILRSGATPVFVDVDGESLTMDPARLEGALTPRTKAIVPVHLYGRPADMAAIAAFAKKKGLLVVEDCAQAHGASIDGRSVGAFGLAAAWSFYPTKNLGALGDGGMVTTSDPDVAARLKRLRVYGYVTKDDAQEIGFNSRLDELQAALLRRRLKRLPAGNARRAALAALYDDRLAGQVALLSKESPGVVPCYHLYVARVPDRDRVKQRLAARGIGTEIHYPNAVHQQPAFASFPRGPLPETEKAVAEILSLPLYPELTQEDVERVAAELLAAIR